MRTKWVLMLTFWIAGMFLSTSVLAQAMYVNPEGNVGVGIQTPLAPMHIYREDATAEFLYLQSDAAGAAQDRAMMFLANNGGIRFEFNNAALGTAWRFQAATGNQDNFEITKVGTGQIELRLDGAGNLDIQGVLTENSDVNAKQAIVPVDPQTVLRRVAALKINQWQYRDTPGVTHIGPMAQDFYAAFGLGAAETKISTLDTSGVALAAIKALSAENAELKLRLEALERQQKQLQAEMVKMLEQEVETQPVLTSWN